MVGMRRHNWLEECEGRHLIRATCEVGWIKYKYKIHTQNYKYKVKKNTNTKCKIQNAKYKMQIQNTMLKTASSRQRDQRVYREVCQVNSMQRQMCVHCTVGLGMGIILIPNKHKGRQRDNCMIKYKIEKTKYKSAWAQLT